jgi:hypothetical protein
MVRDPSPFIWTPENAHLILFSYITMAQGWLLLETLQCSERILPYNIIMLLQGHLDPILTPASHITATHSRAMPIWPDHTNCFSDARETLTMYSQQTRSDFVLRKCIRNSFEHLTFRD